MLTPICLWSGPRNVSTALMYSFAQRGDIQVVDEPLYGHYLRVSGANHPGRNTIMATQNCDGNTVMQQLLLQQRQSRDKRLFVKHMAHHLVDIDLNFLESTDNVFLVREPREMLPSLRIQLPDAELADTGLRQQWKLFADLTARGQNPAILDSRQLLMNPDSVLRQLCRHLGIGFDRGMLRWSAGARREDGVWAPHWYHAVHKSTGFAAYKRKDGFPNDLQALLNDCQPWYEKLFAHAIQADVAS